MGDAGGGGGSPGPAPDRPSVRLRDAMPKPLLVVFGALSVAALVLAVVLIAKPPRSASVPLVERRSPPAGPLSHGVGAIARAPVPETKAPSAAVCAPLTGLRIEAGPAGRERLAAAVRDLCRLAAGGVSPDLRAALLALDRTTLRFASFERTGEESAADLESGVLYVNLRFARARTPTVLVTPVLAHEGWHLARRGRPVTALEEFRARAIELETCRLLIDRDKWIRNCLDAQELDAIGEERAVALLVAAGYPS